VLLTIVSDNYFPLLGVEAARGRLFRDDLDSAMANEPAVAISDSLWRRRYGADPSLAGRSIRMNGRSFTVVGILPPGFRGLNRAVRNDVWVPASTWRAMSPGNRREFEERGTGSFEALARLGPGAGIGQAQAQLDAVAARFRQDQPDVWRGRRFTAATEETRQAGGGLRPGQLLLAIAGLLVLVACANVAVLLLAQAETRRREIGIRLALGAGRWRLARQLLTESALLAAMGGAAALLLVYWLIPLIPALMPPGPDFVRFDIRLDARVVLVTLGTCLATVLLFGLAPALGAGRTDLNGVIKSGGMLARRRFAGRSLLVASQAALGVVLLTAAGLLTGSFLHTRQQRPGFDTDRDMLVLLAGLDRARPQVAALGDEIAGRLRALPGVKNAAYCRRIPMSGMGGGATVDVSIPGREAAPGEEILRLRYNQVSADYFAVTGTRLVAGRAFTRADDGEGAQAVLVSQTMARRFWPNGEAVGRWIRVRNADMQVVGVVEDGVVNHIHEPPEPFVYFPFTRMPTGDVTFLVETAGDPGALLPAVKREMRAASPGHNLLLTSSLRRHMRDALYDDWMPAVLSAAIGALGMVLAAAGLFGVIMQGVNRRMRELAVRMALGARASDLVRMVLRHGLLLAGGGALVGVAASLAAGRLIAGLLHGVSPYDPFVLALSVAAVLVVALAASLYPAWRSTRVDPASVLRAE
jgi:predicted permease